jgi:TPR repeat protein
MDPPSNDDIAAMDYKQLQDACKSAGLSAGGATGTLRKRLRAAFMGINNQDDDVEEPAPKRQKCASDELICPITYELPFYPVTAEDGRVYERAAIEQHMKDKTGEDLKSPITNQPMGRRLYPAVQHKNLIQMLIDTAVITGDLADSWNIKVQEKKAMEDLLKLAESGDSIAMLQIGCNYQLGEEGFKMDGKLSFSWYKRAHEAGDVKGTAFIGIFLLIGKGVTKSLPEGLVYLVSAAERGSDFAAFRLGMAKAEGNWGLSVNSKEAIQWLEKCLSPSCKTGNMADSQKEEATQMLQELLEENG